MGSIGSAWFGGWLVQLFGPRPVLLMAAAFPAAVNCTAFLIREQRVDLPQAAGGHSGVQWFTGLPDIVLLLHTSHRSGVHQDYYLLGPRTFLPRLGLGSVQQRRQCEVYKFISLETGGGKSKAWALLTSQSAALWSAIRLRTVWAPMLFTFFWSVSTLPLFPFCTWTFLHMGIPSLTFPYNMSKCTSTSLQERCVLQHESQCSPGRALLLIWRSRSSSEHVGRLGRLMCGVRMWFRQRRQRRPPCSSS